jgi:hypothetical protein
LNNGSEVSPDEVHSLPNGNPLHVTQDYLANSAALGAGHDVVVTSAYRPEKSSAAHARGAIDIRSPVDHAARLAEAQKISQGFSNNDVLDLVEEVYQMPGGIYQVNTSFYHGVAGKTLSGMQKSKPGKNDQLHARGTHIHLQPGGKFSVPGRYNVSLREDGQPGSEQHLKDGTIYKGPLKNGRPTGIGQQVNPDGIIWTGDFTNGFASPGHWQQTDPEGRVTDVTMLENEDQENDAFVSGRYGNSDKGAFKEGLPTGPGTFETRPGSSFSPSGSHFVGNFIEGILHAQGKIAYDNGEVGEGDFQNDRLNGPGKITFEDGENQEGDFKDGALVAGKVVFKNGNISEGKFKDNHLIAGKVTFKDGRAAMVAEGSFAGGRLNGHGKITFIGGEVQEGSFPSPAL